MFRHTNWATARVLQQNGCDVLVPHNQGCCGAIHFHAGSGEPARAFADANLAAFDTKDLDAVVVNDISRPEIGFDSADNEVTIVTGSGDRNVPLTSKEAIAAAILDEVEALRGGVSTVEGDR